MSRVGPPSPRPCASCPYRRDVPSGVWAADEYDKLPRYDGETFEQPMEVFLCHQNDAGSDYSRICGGWAGCHDGNHLMSLRMAAMTGTMAPEDIDATIDYESPVPLFDSGEEAAEHGMQDIESPSAAAEKAITKIRRVRSDVREG